MRAANDTMVPGSIADAMVGMAMLRRCELRPGQVLYRFVDVTRSPSPRTAANGPWWMEYEAFQHIKHFGQQHGHPLEYSARLHAAVLYEWSEVSGYVRAEVTRPLIAWKGRGKQVSSTGRDPRDLPTMTPMQSVNEIYQLFIPGMHRQSQLYGTALKFIEFLPA